MYKINKVLLAFIVIQSKICFPVLSSEVKSVFRHCHQRNSAAIFSGMHVILRVLDIDDSDDNCCRCSDSHNSLLRTTTASDKEQKEAEERESNQNGAEQLQANANIICTLVYLLPVVISRCTHPFSPSLSWSIYYQ